MSRRKNVTYSARPTHAARSAHAKGEKLFRTYDTSYIRPKPNPVPAIVCIVALVVVVVAVVIFVLTSTRSCAGAALVPEGTQVEVVVAEGEGANSVAKTLVESGLIANQDEFTNRLRETGAENSLHPGTYVLTGGQSLDEMITVLQTPVAAVTFTVPEGSTVAQTADIVAQASEGRITAEAFVAAAADASVYAGDFPFLASAGSNSLEGFLFPKTYPIAEDSTADSIIRAMLTQFGEETASLDFSVPESHGLSLYQTVNLASIVEREDNGSHQAEVASVFYNRLDDGWMLQSDATMAYVVGREPTPEELGTYHDYNTYTIQGLPPTPIDSPSLACLQAVCSPADTSYYYFYYDEGGNVTFSETYEDHQASYE